jgi:DNA polymerase/3'-5' exonuclease PolX
LISHPKLGEESFILKRLVEILDSKGLTVTGKYNRKSDHDWTKSTSHRDHFETFISILKFPIFKDSKKIKTNSESENNLNKVLESLDANKFHRDWIARRCDLIVCSIDELPFAVMAWTGSRQFNRSIRLYSDKEFNYKLSAHGLFDNKIVISI